ncbi:hypothetical protein ACEWY4_004320 [Coilia grayii]|uniref:Uncharacterized protein n=1 Tax=Coilia grayii TaxID=363190 RepID=A0ABD1KL66_9TELE
MRKNKDVAAKPVMEAEGGGGHCRDAPRPVRSGKGAGCGWRVLLCCFLCVAAQPGLPDREQGPGEHRPGTAGMMKWRNVDISQLTTDAAKEDTDIAKEDTDTSKQGKENKTDKKLREERKKQAKKTSGRTLVHWCRRFFTKSAASANADGEWRWGVAMSEEQRLRQRQEAKRRERAWLEANSLRRERERTRRVFKRYIQRSRKTVVANQLWSSLPLRAEDATTVVTFSDTPTPSKTGNNERKPSHRELEWHVVLNEIRMAEMEKKMAENMRWKMTWRTFPKARSFNLKKYLCSLVMGCSIFLLTWAETCASALSNWYLQLQLD